MTFSPHDRQGFGPEELPAQPLYQHDLVERGSHDFCDIPRQVHSLLKKGLNDRVQDICTTERSLTP